MRLTAFFHRVNIKDTLEKEGIKFPVVKNNIFSPHPERDNNLDLYIELVKEDVMASLKKSNKFNHTGEENSAFYVLLHKNCHTASGQKSGIVLVDKG